MGEDILGPGPREEVDIEVQSEEKEFPSRKGLLKVKCSCGNIANLSEEVIEDGLSWSMLIGNEHFLTLMCPKCNAKLTMYIEEIQDELPEESKQE
jgi:hypothetical protein